MMINSKRNVAIALFAVLVGAVLGVTWWLAQDRASAQEILYNACEQTAQQSFDFTSRLTRTEEGEPTESYDVQGVVSGSDFAMTVTRLQPTAGTPFQILGVDGVTYFQENGKWVPDEYGVITIQFVHSFLNSKALETEDANVLCPDVGPVMNVGSDVINGVTVQHLQVNDETIGPVANVGNISVDTSEQHISGKTWDYWVGTDGVLVQIGQVYDLSEGDVKVGQLEMASTISGVGEPNAIPIP